jgi:hypothetical protein
MLEQERCSKILESVLNDHADQRHLQGEHDFPRPWDIDKVSGQANAEPGATLVPMRWAPSPPREVASRSPGVLARVVPIEGMGSSQRGL